MMKLFHANLCLVIAALMLVPGHVRAAESAANAMAGVPAAEEGDAETVPGVAADRIIVKPRYVPTEACNYIKAGKPFETQLDVFTQEGVYTFCGQIDEQESGHFTFAPAYKYKSFTSWADHSCATDGTSLVPDDYRVRCIKREYFVDKAYYCKREGDKDGDGFVDSVKNVPVAMADFLGAFVVNNAGGSNKLVMAKGADIDAKLSIPSYYSDLGNVSLATIPAQKYGQIARSYAFPRKEVTLPERQKAKVESLAIVVHDRQSDILKNTYFSEALLKDAGSPIVVGPCPATPK
jgi:hypothetical protein